MSFAWESFSIVPISQGQFDVTNDPNVVYSTLLGSCVSVCLFSEELRAGGLNHFLLPGTGDGSDTGERYGVNAMEMLINGLIKMGATRSSLKSKVFGGSSMSAGHEAIGKSNGIFAKDFLGNEGIECVSTSIGGTQARRIHFHPASGRVRQFQVPNNIDEEALYRSTKEKSKPSSDIVLF